MKTKIIGRFLLLMVVLSLISASCGRDQLAVVNKSIDNGASTGVVKKAIYDGTYMGVFNYSYGSGSDTSRPYTPAVLNVTVTFDSTLRPQTSPGNVILSITNVIVDDPAFWTGDAGVVPEDDPIDGGPSIATFPVDPANPQKTGLVLAAFIPGGASVVAAFGSPGDLTISPDGKNISGTVWAAGAYEGIWASYGNYF